MLLWTDKYGDGYDLTGRPTGWPGLGRALVIWDIYRNCLAFYARLLVHCIALFLGRAAGILVNADRFEFQRMNEMSRSGAELSCSARLGLYRLSSAHYHLSRQQQLDASIRFNATGKSSCNYIFFSELQERENQLSANQVFKLELSCCCCCWSVYCTLE